MELFIKVYNSTCPTPLRDLTKIVNTWIDKFVSLFEYLYPDFGGD